jgi:alanine racemase
VGSATSEPAGRFSSWAEVDLEAIADNVAAVRRHTRRQVMAVVKADGYGHGAVPVARAALAAGATWLGVARFEEAAELREAGLEVPILLLGLTPPERLAEAVALDVALTAWSAEQVDAAAVAAARAGRPARLHLKVDTGMSRLGVTPEGARDLAQHVRGRRAVVLEGIFTHFACADDPASSSADDQLRLFGEVVDSLGDVRPPLVHAANSAAILRLPGSWLDLVRLGIAMYGLSPGAAVPLLPGMRPAMTWKAVLAQVKTLPPGRGISYGHTYVTTRTERIGTLPVGYADGWRRIDGNEVLVRGRRLPIVGRVCMDQCMVRLDDVPGAAPGDEVVLVGRQGDDEITGDDVAARWGTIGYEVVCVVGRRVPRVYRRGPGAGRPGSPAG